MRSTRQKTPTESTLRAALVSRAIEQALLAATQPLNRPEICAACSDITGSAQLVHESLEYLVCKGKVLRITQAPDQLPLYWLRSRPMIGLRVALKSQVMG